MSVKPIPEGYHTATPYLICGGAANAIEFYKKAFGAKERMRSAPILDEETIHKLFGTVPADPEAALVKEEGDE